MVTVLPWSYQISHFQEMKSTWIMDCNKQGEKSANHAYTYSFTQKRAHLLCEKRGINKRNNFGFLLKAVGANRKNEANFGSSGWVGAVGEESAALTVRVLTLTLLTEWYRWIPRSISLAPGRAMASQGETFMALKANSIFVCVVIFENRYSPVLELWDRTYHLWKVNSLSQRGSRMYVVIAAYLKSIFNVPLLRGISQVGLGDSQENNFKNWGLFSSFRYPRVTTLWYI